MKVLRPWLQKFVPDLPEAAVIADALTFHAFEIDSVEGEVLDVKVTPNRGHDALSHRAVAKELAAVLKLQMTYDPLLQKPDLSKVTTEVSVSLESPLCNRYIAGYMKGVKVGPSPSWLKESLEAIGQRSINNVVDATNFVMFKLGQPLHAFDAKKLPSLSIGVRTAHAGEEIETLDAKKYSLTDTMLLITAGDVPVGIAGIKGGMPASVDESTVDIVIESANFDGPSVRKASRSLALRTDASSRFEQVLSPELAAYGMVDVVAIIQKVAGGELVGFVDSYPVPQKLAEVSVSLEKINKMLGTEISKEKVLEAFSSLGLACREESGVFTVTPPFERLDLSIPEDLVEEVGRVIGYEHVPAVPLPPIPGKTPVNGRFVAAEQAREELRSAGYSEILTSVFVEKGERAVANKIGGDKPYLRASLLTGLTEALAKNVPNKALLELKEVKLFEIGIVWKDGMEKLMLGKIGEKEPASEKEIENVAAENYERLLFTETMRYQPFSRYPYISRDIALWVPKGTEADEVQTVIRDAAGDPLLLKTYIFDRFEKGDRISYAFRLIFQSFEKTLVDAEVNAVMEKVIAAIKEKAWEVR
ncbi:phenylalanine--tRNA ligase subunit beta [Candidatus Parcubacteria bacterium]|nr:phenylalanine--tRNA ligase subunit beta [Candidatus Parcubacteria bacterium]